MFKEMLFIIIMMSLCQSVFSLELVKGEQYEVCQDLLKFYIRGNDQYLEPRHLINTNKGKFKVLKRTEEKKSLAQKIAMQASAYKSRSFDKWKRRVNRLEEIHKNSTLQVSLINVDINNNGETNKVVSTSRRTRLMNVWSDVNYIIDDENNVHRDFFTVGSPTSSTGELFLFEIGRAHV